MKTGQRRMVHLSIFSSAQVSRLSRDARLLYMGLIVLGDDDGRLKASPALLRSQVYPYDDEVKIADVAKWLKEVVDQKLVVSYDVDGESYLYHPKWEDYQQLREDRRRDSNIPAPQLEFFPLTTSRQPSGNQAGAEPPRKISKDKGSKDKVIDPAYRDHSFQVFWEAYPLKVGKKAAWKAWQKVDVTPELAARVMASLAAWKASDQWTKDQGRYIPHPATWINGERWEDEVRAQAPKNSKYAAADTKTVRAS